jgi:hypothetical protein
MLPKIQDREPEIATGIRRRPTSLSRKSKHSIWTGGAVGGSRRVGTKKK